MIERNANCPKCHRPTETSGQMFPGHDIEVARCEKCIQYAVIGDSEWLDGLLVGLSRMSQKLFERAMLLQAKASAQKPQKVKAEA